MSLPLRRRELPGPWAREAYRSMPWRVRFHVTTRWFTCPFEAVEAEVPQAGRVLDLGCGHGAFALRLAQRSLARQVVGSDVDTAKLAVAHRAAQAIGATNVGFEAVDPNLSPVLDGYDGWDAITIIDVLYLLGPKQARNVLAAAAARLRPGGVIVVKESATHPWWKFQVSRAQELIATKVARVTQGEAVRFVPPAEIAAALAQNGLAVTQRRVDQGRIHPHHLLVGTADSGRSFT